MPVISSILFVVALYLAVLLGPQTRPWTWGPSLMVLAVAVLAALPSLWKRSLKPVDFCLLIFGAIVTGWFAWRAMVSPVREFAVADLLLLGSVVSSLIVMRSIAADEKAEKIFIWSLSLLLLASVGVIFLQIADPNFTAIFHSRPAPFPSGFYGHYNEGANFLIAASFLVGGAAVFGRERKPVRWIWGAIAILGLLAVYFTRSRGGVLGVVVGAAVFVSIALLIGKRKDAKWFAPVMIGAPIFGILLAGFLFIGWSSAQEFRGYETTEASSVLDNPIRLRLLGIAASAIATHPLTGGGSRSYSWECFKFWDNNQHGGGVTRPEYVHNELVQAATDYGLIGAGLLVVLLSWIVVLGIARCIFNPARKMFSTSDSLVLGALAGLAGMFVQSNFSFVFHLLPGAILLGICLGRLSHGEQDFVNRSFLKNTGSRLLWTVAALSCAVFLLPKAWTGSRVFVVLWPTFFGSRTEASPEYHIDALAAATPLWPQATLFRERAMHHQKLAISTKTGSEENTASAIKNYREAIQLHPFDTISWMNLALLLSSTGQQEKATEAFVRTIELQGGMEWGFRANERFIEYLVQTGLTQITNQKPADAIATFELGTHYLKGVLSSGNTPLTVSVYEGLGAAHEMLGDYDRALEAYDFVAANPLSGRVQYRAAALVAKMAGAAWSGRRPEEALFLFQDARKRVEPCQEFPPGITHQHKEKLVHYLDQNIEFLIGARVQPVDPSKK